MHILGIETSCDETALALLECTGPLSNPTFKVLKETVASQIKIHQPFGGVVPTLAKREHLINLPLLEKKIFDKGKKAEALWKKIDAIAVTVGPGLEPALWAGITFAQELAKRRKKPLIGTNHLEGHLYSFLLPGTSKIPAGAEAKKILPAIALIVSGGVLVGRFTGLKRHMNDGALGIDDVLDHYFGPLGVPVAYGLPIGHIDDQWTMPLGVRARFDAGAGTVELLEPAVA